MFRREVAALAETAGADEEVLDAVRLAVTEAVSNVVLHAYADSDPGPVRVDAWREQDHFVVLVRDDGAGLIPRPENPGMGVGIALMAQMADGFLIGNWDGEPGTVVSLRFSLSRSVN